MKKEILSCEGLRYLRYAPEPARADEKYPVILFLHGAGSRGTEISVLEENTITRYLRSHVDLPFILVEPQTECDTWFERFERLIRFAEAISEDAQTDKSRFYLAGNSMGGYTAWMLAMARPELFAALVPICGGGMSWNAQRLKDLPIWAFHGLLDDVVPVEESVHMVAAVKRAGGNARLTIYPDVKHDSWENALSDETLYQWLLAQRKTL